jgi:hypothetical protein
LLKRTGMKLNKWLDTNRRPAWTLGIRRFGRTAIGEPMRSKMGLGL